MNNVNDLQQLEWLNDAQPEILNRVIELCNLNSGTGNLAGISQVGDLLTQWFGELGATFESIALPPREFVDSRGLVVEQSLGSALHFVKRADVRPRILLCIHMDTVYGPQDPFQECRMLSREHHAEEISRLMESDDLPRQVVNGPGVADAKGGLMIMLYALQALERHPLAKHLGWEVIINPDEELGSPCSNQFLRARAAEANYGLLFEPALPDGTLVSWRKGSGNFDFVVRGRAAHSGREFEKGRNAIAALSQLLCQVHELNTDPEITYNVGRIEGGGALNIVPDLAIGRVNVRLRTVAQQQLVLDRFSEIVSRVEQLDGISVEQHGEFSSPPKPADSATEQLQQRIERCGEKLGLPVAWRSTGGASDGNKFAAAGLPNVDTMGPRGGNIHSKREFMIPDSLPERAMLTAAVMLDIASEAASS